MAADPLRWNSRKWLGRGQAGKVFRTLIKIRDGEPGYRWRGLRSRPPGLNIRLNRTRTVVRLQGRLPNRMRGVKQVRLQVQDTTGRTIKGTFRMHVQPKPRRR